MKFAAPVLVGQAIHFLERGVQPGLVHLTSTDPTGWTRVDRLDQIPLPTERPARLLLFVHGTFSSTVAAFGVLGLTPEGQAFLGAALTAYDAVIGYDHPTLSVDPLANATDLLQRVQTVAGPVTFDVVCHSRGGLTARSFIEHVLPGSGWNATVERAVFVAATNGGTNLANSDRWGDLIDLTTNLVAASARVLAMLSGAGPVVAVVGGVVKGLGAFVKYLVSYAVGADGVPGLAAMAPDGPFVTELNQTQPGQPLPGAPGTSCRRTSMSRLFDGGHQPQEFPRELAVRLAEGLLDRVFKDANDLVVDVRSMSQIDVAAGDYVGEELAFGENETVYHNNYFNQERPWRPCSTGSSTLSQVSLRRRRPRPVPGRQRRDRCTEGARSSWVRPQPRRTERAPRRARGERSDRGRVSASDARRAALPRAPSRRRVQPPATEPVTAYLRAELPAYPVVAKPATLTVRLSRKKLAAAAAMAGMATTFLALPDRRLTVQVVPKTNVKIKGNDTDSFELPAGRRQLRPPVHDRARARGHGRAVGAGPRRCGAAGHAQPHRRGGRARCRRRAPARPSWPPRP